MKNSLRKTGGKCFKQRHSGWREIEDGPFDSRNMKVGTEGKWSLRNKKGGLVMRMSDILGVVKTFYNICTQQNW